MSYGSRRKAQSPTGATQLDLPFEDARPCVAERYLAWPEARPLFGGISRATAWRGVRDGWLPAPLPMSPGRKAWALSEILAWQRNRR